MAELISAYPPSVWAVLLATGVLIGLLAGLLGVGGGIVAVPVLLEVFDFIGVPGPASIALAVGTAQASILVASGTATAAHWRSGTIDRDVARAWLPALIAGAIAGLLLGVQAPPKLLTALFAGVAAALAASMVLGDPLVLVRGQPQRFLGAVPPLVVGALASAVGVGGGTLSTPVLSLFAFPIHRVIGAGALFNVVVALPATVFALATGCGTSGRPADAVGSVALFCVAALSLPALFVAPAAARRSARVPAALLRRLFALCLAAIAARMLFRP